MKFVKISELQSCISGSCLALQGRLSSPEVIRCIKPQENFLPKLPLLSVILCGHLPVYQIKMELNRKDFAITWKHTPENE